MQINDDKLKALLEEKGEIQKVINKNFKASQKLEKENNELGVKLNEIKEKMAPIVNELVTTDENSIVGGIDLVKGFIKVDLITLDDFVKESEQKAKDAWKSIKKGLESK